MAKAQKPRHGLPTRDQILTFVQTGDRSAGKREIAREFGLKGQEKIALKALLKDMTDEGLVNLAPGRAFTKMGGLPKVTVLRVVAIEEDRAIAVPENWEADAPPPKLRVIEKARKGALGVGDRVLARTEDRGGHHVAHVMKKLERAEDMVLGVITVETGDRGKPDRHWLRAVDKKARRDWAVSDIGTGEPGDLVLAEIVGRGPRQSVAVREILGDPLAPKSFSEIAIHKYGIPYRFPDAVTAEAETAAALALGDRREDLTHLPIVAIDPADARDHDDAIWAARDDDPANSGGFKAVVAIADVSFYVRPGSMLDKEARKRANSVYFPDQVVPMLPERLSADVCSLKAGEDRAAMACHLTIDAQGRLANWRFTRARVRLAANIAYEDAQAAIDGDSPLPLAGGAGGGRATQQTSPGRPTPNPSRKREGDAMVSILRPLWNCWALLKAARDRREPLDLDLPERRVEIDETGRISSVAVRERLDAHRLVEDFMIAANVAAAKALEAKASPVMYRVHEVPSREKLVAMKDFLKSLDIEFALGQVVRPATFNHILGKIADDGIKAQVMEQVLRTQTQAYYGPNNMGHFGLALGSYAHFTSPIRRYADLLVHRALVDAYRLEQGKPADRSIPAHSGLAREDVADMAKIGQAISDAERRAMQAERETVDRYVAAFLSERVGEIVDARITGVLNFGFFATVDGIGGDGLVPVRTLGSEHFDYDEATQTLTGSQTGTAFTTGQRIELRLIEADPIKASLLFELPERTSGASGGGGGGSGRRHDVNRGGKPKPSGNDDKSRGSQSGKPRAPQVRRGRPANIRHQGNKKKR